MCWEKSPPPQVFQYLIHYHCQLPKGGNPSKPLEITENAIKSLHRAKCIAFPCGCGTVLSMVCTTPVNLQFEIVIMASGSELP
jgi:hypothetical protein